VPPFNGFSSKWLIIAACLLSGAHFPPFLVFGLVGMFVSLATLASFLKVLGAVFLGSPDENHRPREVPFAMALPQVVLAGLCILFGLFPQVPLGFIRDALAGVSGTALPTTESLWGGAWGMALAVDGTTVAYWYPLVVAGSLAVLALLVYGLQRGAGARMRDVPAWTCGEEHGPALVRYPASSFYQPFEHAFEKIYPRLEMRAPRFPVRLRRAFECDGWLYAPVVHGVMRAAERVSRTHVGTPQVYLLWMVIGALVVTMIMVALVT